MLSGLRKLQEGALLPVLTIQQTHLPKSRKYDMLTQVKGKKCDGHLPGCQQYVTFSKASRPET